MNDKSRLQSFFDSLSKDSMHLVDEYYDSRAHFEDPLGRHDGVAEIKKYYAHLYDNVISIRFEYSGELVDKNERVLFWKMFLKHKALKGGEEVTTSGSSHVRFDPKTQKIIYHRDYFDVGEFLYENIPVFGSAVRYIKKKAASY